jgi:hypothetical protein
MRSEQAYFHNGPTGGASDAARSGNFAASVAASAGAHARHGLRALALLALAGTFALALWGCELFPSNASSFSGTKYAVVVGINDYIDSCVNDLNYCVADANSMKETLEASGWAVYLITDKNATKARSRRRSRPSPPARRPSSSTIRGTAASTAPTTPTSCRAISTARPMPA